MKRTAEQRFKRTARRLKSWQLLVFAIIFIPLFIIEFVRAIVLFGEDGR